MNKFGIVESHFEYKGHDCICLFTVKGYRCGYVSVDDNRDFWDYDLDCHCGLSFGASPLLKDFKPKSDMYIGFDCGHSCDGYDYDTALKSVSYVPKDFGNLHPYEKKDFTKKFGWVNFTVLNPLEIRPK